MRTPKGNTSHGSTLLGMPMKNFTANERRCMRQKTPRPARKMSDDFRESSGAKTFPGREFWKWRFRGKLSSRSVESSGAGLRRKDDPARWGCADLFTAAHFQWLRVLEH